MTAHSPARPRRTADDIVDAVAVAAHDLFLDRPPSAVSLREIATHADVNLGLIHRYVGSKDDLIALVVRRHTAHVRSLIDEVRVGDALGLLDQAALHAAASPSSGRLLAGMALDGIDIARLKGEFPLMERLANDAAPLDAAMLTAFLLGWEIFGDLLLEASGAAPADDDAVIAALRRTLRAMRASAP